MMKRIHSHDREQNIKILVLKATVSIYAWLDGVGGASDWRGGESARLFMFTTFQITERLTQITKYEGPRCLVDEDVTVKINYIIQ